MICFGCGVVMAEELVQTQRAIQRVMLHSEVPSPSASLWLRTSGGSALTILLPGNRERKGKAVNTSRSVHFPASGLGLTGVFNLTRLQDGGGFPLPVWSLSLVHMHSELPLFVDGFLIPFICCPS